MSGIYRAHKLYQENCKKERRKKILFANLTVLIFVVAAAGLFKLQQHRREEAVYARAQMLLRSVAEHQQGLLVIKQDVISR